MTPVRSPSTTGCVPRSRSGRVRSSRDRRPRGPAMNERDPRSDGRPARRRARPAGCDDGGRPHGRRQHVRCRRRPAPRDDREPGGGRPRERAAGAVAQRAVAAQGAAPPPGLPRLVDRPCEPRPVRRGGRATAGGRRGRRRLPVVLFLDLDDFKVVNDTLGHPVGDQLLVAVAERIRHEIRGEDLAARLGGDEFAILPAPGTDIGAAPWAWAGGSSTR